MSAQLELIAKMNKAQERLERLESREQRWLITDYDWLRGWSDDFLGDYIDDRYTQVLVGAGSAISLMDGVHGGRIQLRAGAALGRYAQLWLGDNLDGYDSITPSLGFIMLGKWGVSSTTDIVNMFGVNNSALNRRVLVRCNTTVGANWLLVCQDGGGTTTVDTGIAFDTAQHYHAIDCNADRVLYSLDGVQVAECTANIHNAALTPVMDVQARAAATRDMRADWWRIIPR